MFIVAWFKLSRAAFARLGRLTSIRQSAFGLSVMTLIFALAACGGGTRGGPIPYDVATFGPPDAPSSTVLGADYRIAPLDTLTVTVFRVPDVSGDFQVDLTGRIAMPLIGSVRAVDLTPEQLEAELVRQLGERYLRNPDVTVGIKTSTRRTVTVDGSVERPGMFPVTGPITLLQVIALAGGPDDNANPRRIAIFRQIEGQRMAAAFDLTSIRRGQAQDPPIYSGDIVVVDGSGVNAARREILQAIPLLSLFRPFLL